MANDGDNDTCLELALEGEKLCKSGKCRDGVAFFEAALQSGTDDFRTLSAIYSQLGNAYFYLGDYVKVFYSRSSTSYSILLVTRYFPSHLLSE